MDFFPKNLRQVIISKNMRSGRDKRRKGKYSDKRSLTNLHAIKRKMFRDQRKYSFEDYYVPNMNLTTYNWWDCKPSNSASSRFSNIKYFKWDSEFL